MKEYLENTVPETTISLDYEHLPIIISVEPKESELNGAFDQRYMRNSGIRP